MNDALGMNDDGDATYFDVEQPASFDHFESLVEEGCGIVCDFAAHDPGRMFQSTLDCDVREFFLGWGAEGTTGSGEPEFADGVGRLAFETLKNGGTLAVHGQDADTMFAGLAHDNFAGHNEDFLGSDGDVLTGANRGKSGAKAG